MIKEEIWVDIKGFDGKYQVSNLGGVRSFANFFRYGKNKKPRMLTLHKDPRGRWQASLHINRRLVCPLVHRLVAQHFPPPPSSPDQTCVFRIDGDLNNNSRDNLRWGRYDEKRGGRSIRKVLLTFVKTGETVEYESVKDAAEKLSLYKPTVYAIIRGVQKSRKYRIEYADGKGILHHSKPHVRKAIKKVS